MQFSLKLLWKTRKSVLQADLQGRGGQWAPSVTGSAVIAASLEVTGGKVVQGVGHPQAVLREKSSNAINIHTQLSRFFDELCSAVSYKCWKAQQGQGAFNKTCVCSSRKNCTSYDFVLKLSKTGTTVKKKEKLNSVVNRLVFSFWVTKIQTRIHPWPAGNYLKSCISKNWDKLYILEQ